MAENDLGKVTSPQFLESRKKKKGEILSVFSVLPEGCISSIIAFTSPKDASRAASISLDFKSASESDTVWERFLPSDYKEIVSKAVGPLYYATKKELFFGLCNFPIIISDGKLSFWISKSSGKKCYMLSAKELSIAWKDTPAHWIWRSIPESRFSKVAELKRVCWLDIEGKMQTQMLSLKTTYAAYLVFRVAEDFYGLDVFAKASVRFPEASNTSIDLIEPQPESKPYSVSLIPRRHGCLRQSRRHGRPAQSINRRVPRQRYDGWMEIFLGEFFNDEGEGDIEMKLWETETLNWKRGLILEGIELRPNEEV